MNWLWKVYLWLDRRNFLHDGTHVDSDSVENQKIRPKKMSMKLCFLELDLCKPRNRNFSVFLYLVYRVEIQNRA